MFGNPETTTGGRALKFYSSVRVDVRRIASIKDGDEVTGNRTKAKIVKNKVAPPFREAEFDIMYGEGISREGDLLDLGVDKNVVDKSGAWFSFQGERLGQGRDNARTVPEGQSRLPRPHRTRGPRNHGSRNSNCSRPGISRCRRLGKRTREKEVIGNGPAHPQSPQSHQEDGRGGVVSCLPDVDWCSPWRPDLPTRPTP